MLLHALLLITLSGVSAAHAQQDELTLEEFITQVTAANPALSAAEQRSEAMQRRVKPASTLDDPFLAFGVDEIPFGEQRVELYRYQASQSFPFPGKLRAREAVAKQRAKASEHDAETQRREFTVIATQQFYRAFYNSQAAQKNQQLREILRASMQSAKSRYEAGGADHHDWLLAKLELATLSVEQQRIERERLFLQATINELRGRPPEDPLEKIAVDFSDLSTDYGETSLDEQPEVATLDAQAAQAGDEYRLAKLGYYPDIVVQAMAMQPRDAMGEEESNWGVMVGFNLPLYSSRKQSNLVAAARHEQHAVEMEKLYLRNRLRTEIVNARQALSSARQMVELYEDEVLPSTQSALASAQSGYQARRLELSTYLSILRVQKTQQLELVAARIDVQLAKTRLKELLSTPPLLQLAPSRPTVFGGGDMGGGMQSSDAVSMGSGMSAAKKTGKGTSPAAADGASGMGGMQ